MSLLLYIPKNVTNYPKYITLVIIAIIITNLTNIEPVLAFEKIFTWLDTIANNINSCHFTQNKLTINRNVASWHSYVYDDTGGKIGTVTVKGITLLDSKGAILTSIPEITLSNQNSAQVSFDSSRHIFLPQHLYPSIQSIQINELDCYGPPQLIDNGQ